MNQILPILCFPIPIKVCILKCTNGQIRKRRRGEIGREKGDDGPNMVTSITNEE